MTNAKPYRLPWKKRLLKHPLFQSCVTWLIAQLLRLSWHSFRIERNVHPDALPYLQGKETGIFCFWHGRMIIFPCLKPKGHTMHVLISHHRDGQLIASVIRHFGIQTVHGSSHRGAREATRNLIRLLHEGDNISITPDGPRGPLYEAQDGAAALARLAKKPIIPVSFSASRRRCMKSWDRFMIPLPFSTIHLAAAAPIHAHAGGAAHSVEEITHELQRTLRTITSQMDEAAGHAP